VAFLLAIALAVVLHKYFATRVAIGGVKQERPAVLTRESPLSPTFGQWTGNGGWRPRPRAA